MVVLYAGAIVILPMDLPVFLKFIAITVFTIIMCCLIYEFILRRVALLRPLFGMKWTSKKMEKSELQGYT